MAEKEDWSKFGNKDEDELNLETFDDESNQDVEGDETPKQDVDNEDTFDKLVGKNYIEIESPDKSKKEKVPVVLNIAKELELPSISNAPDSSPELEAEKIMYSTDPKSNPVNQINKYFVAAGVVLAVIIVLVVFLVFIKDEVPAVTDNVNTTIDESVAFVSTPIKYSFNQYINPEDNNYNKDVSLICFLKNELRDVGREIQYIDYYAVDDYGNEIKLNFFRLKNPAMYEYLFIKNSTTKTLFNVSGSLRKEGFQELKLYVSNISNAEREYEISEIN